MSSLTVSPIVIPDSPVTETSSAPRKKRKPDVTVKEEEEKYSVTLDKEAQLKVDELRRTDPYYETCDICHPVGYPGSPRVCSSCNARWKETERIQLYNSLKAFMMQCKSFEEFEQSPFARLSY